MERNHTVSIKSKALGLIGAGILSMSVFTGAALAQAYETNPVQVVLSPSGNDCESAVTSGTVDFGTYQYDSGTGQYVYSIAGTNSTLSFGVAGPSGPNQVCGVNVAADNLSGTNLGGVIPVNNLGISSVAIASGNAGTGNFSNYFSFNGSWQQFVTNANLTFGENATVTFNAASIATMNPDTYTSTIYVQSFSVTP